MKIRDVQTTVRAVHHLKGLKRRVFADQEFCVLFIGRPRGGKTGSVLSKNLAMNDTRARISNKQAINVVRRECAAPVNDAAMRPRHGNRFQSRCARRNTRQEIIAKHGKRRGDLYQVWRTGKKWISQKIAGLVRGRSKSVDVIQLQLAAVIIKGEAGLRGTDFGTDPESNRIK